MVPLPLLPQAQGQPQSSKPSAASRTDSRSR